MLSFVKKFAPLACVLLLTGCPFGGPFGFIPPGKGPQAMVAYMKARPIIHALEKYNQDKQGYPEKLDRLVPDYLKDYSGDFGYARDGDSYSLHFSYTGPGMNHCTYKPQAGKWDCFGYY